MNNRPKVTREEQPPLHLLKAYIEPGKTEWLIFIISYIYVYVIIELSLPNGKSNFSTGPFKFSIEDFYADKVRCNVRNCSPGHNSSYLVGITYSAT